jgi:uncharacterized protein
MFNSQFETAQYLNFSTKKRDGSTVETPVWFAYVGDHIYVYSEGDSGKVKRLKNFSQSRVAVCTVSGRLKGGWVDTQAILLRDEAEKKSAYASLCRKYGWKLKSLDLISRLAGKINQRAFIQITAV